MCSFAVPTLCKIFRSSTEKYFPDEHGFPVYVCILWFTNAEAWFLLVMTYPMALSVSGYASVYIFITSCAFGSPDSGKSKYRCEYLWYVYSL